MTARHMADGVSHREYRQSKRQRNTGKTDAERWEGGRQHRTTAAAEHEPEGADEFRGKTFGHIRCDSRCFATVD